MISIVKSMALHGLDGYLVDVQVDISNGLPYLEIVGLPDTSIREAKERVKSAIRNCSEEFPSRRIIVNLAPADTKKEGSIFDLAIAIGILNATGRIAKDLKDTVFIGELSLDGTLNKVNGVLPMCIEAVKLGIQKIILPQQNAKEAAIVNGIKVIPVNNLNEVINFLNGIEEIEPEKVNIQALFANKEYGLDFCEVKGQESVKRALEIAAAGGHNILLIGSPRFWKNHASKKNSFYTTRFNF